MEKIFTFSIALLLFSFTIASAQDIAVQGKVVDQQNLPLPGVSVKVKNSNMATSTDTNGQFTLKAGSGDVLVFTFIGFKTQEVIAGPEVINLTMTEESTQLNEVVVIGYGTQKRGDVTTSIASVSTKDIESRPIVQAAQALQGKAAGVQVSQPSGKPGSALSIRVRGATSVQAGNEPLYVIDGVPTTDSRDLNVNDIASIQVLKDASSAAIYGARAANGVVIVTTKRGKANTSNINFSTYYGFANLSKKINVLNPEQYSELMQEMGYSINADEVTDWTKEVFKTGQNQNYQLSFSGGNDKNQYFVSGALTKDEGIVRPADYNRYAFRMNLDNQVKEWFKLSTNLSYSNAKIHDVKDNDNAGRNAVILGALNAPPTMGIYMYDDQGRRMYTMNPNKSGWDNPLGAIYGPTQSSMDNRVFGNVTGDLSIIKNLRLRSNFGIDYLNHKYDFYIDYIQTTPGRNAHGSAQAEKSNSFTYLWENTINFDQSWDKHNVSALAGMTIQKNRWNNSFISGRDFPEDPTVKTLNAANQIDDASTNESEWFLNSYLARVMYNYESKYLLTVNFRADGSSKLASNHRWGYFPSVSAGWRISGEPFMEDVAVINDLKIRGGWGQNGNVEGLANYASLGLNTFSRRSPTDPPSGPAVNPPSDKMPNPDLRWETTTQTNIGIDLSMFNSRLTFTADAYIKKTKDLILPVQLPSTTGYNSIDRNSGKLENKGLEFVISSVNMNNDAFKWNTDFNISFNKNKITDLELTQIYRYQAVEGRDQIAILQKGVSLGTYSGYKAEGVDPATGDMIYRDINGDGVVTPTDRTFLGSAQPDFTYGLNNDFTYKNWNFSFLFQGSQGNKAFNASRIETEGLYDSKNQSTEVLKRWTTPGQITDIPRATDGNVYNSRISSRFVEDASFLRLKSTTLSYELGEKVAEKLKLNRLSVYITGQNIFTITNYKGFDPEINAFTSSGATLGIDYGTYPTARAFILGLNMQF
jgi:TonB-linked SusC/RagA family outer membrane protein